MDTEHLKKLLDTCFLAKKVIETLPELPKGMKPRHIHVLEAIYEITCKQESCTVSNIRDRMQITMPSISKLIQELEALHMIEKEADREDRRFYQLKLTWEGTDCVKKHVLDFHKEWAKRLAYVENQKVEEAVNLFTELRNTMPGGEI